MRKAGKGQQEYLIVKMNDVIITSVKPAAAATAATAENVAPAVRQGRPRIQAAEGRRLARCRRPLQVRHQGATRKVSCDAQSDTVSHVAA